MSVKSRSDLKQVFITGAKPTQQNFSDWLDSYRHVADLQQPSLAAAPTPVNGDLWYNTVQNQFQGTRNGAAQNFLMGNDAILNQGATEQPADAKISGGYSGAGFYTNGWQYQGLYLTNFGHIYGLTDLIVYDTTPGISQSFRIGGAPVVGIDWKGISVNGRLLLSEVADDIIPGEPLSGGIYYNSTVQRFRGRINGVYNDFLTGNDAIRNQTANIQNAAFRISGISTIDIGGSGYCPLSLKNNISGRGVGMLFSSALAADRFFGYSPNGLDAWSFQMASEAQVYLRPGLLDLSETINNGTMGIVTSNFMFGSTSGTTSYTIGPNSFFIYDKLNDRYSLGIKNNGNIILGNYPDNGGKFQVNDGALNLAAGTTDYTSVAGGLQYRADMNKARVRDNIAWKNIATEDWVNTIARTGHEIIVDKDSPNATDTRNAITPYSLNIPFSSVSAAAAAAVSGDVIVIRKAATPYSDNVIIANGTLTFRLEEGAVIDGGANAAFKTNGQCQVLIAMMSYSVIKNEGSNEPALYTVGNSGIVVRGTDALADGIVSATPGLDSYSFLPLVQSHLNAAIEGFGYTGYNACAISGVVIRSTAGTEAVRASAGPISRCIIVADAGRGIAGTSNPHLSYCKIVSSGDCIADPGSVGLTASNCSFYSTSGMGISMTNNNAGSVNLYNCMVNAKYYAVMLQSNPTFAVEFQMHNCCFGTRDAGTAQAVLIQLTGPLTGGVRIASNITVNRDCDFTVYAQLNNIFQVSEPTGAFPVI